MTEQHTEEKATRRDQLAAKSSAQTTTESSKSMNPINCRLKKGETDPETGLIVYRYFSHDPSKPYLVTPEKFKAIRDKEEARKARWAAENVERANMSKAAWVERNPASAKESKDKWLLENKDRAKVLAKEARTRNPEAYKAIAKRTAQKNRAKINKRAATRQKERRKTDYMFAMRCRVRARLTTAFQNRRIPKGTRTETMIGCDWQTLANFIQSQFSRGMSWANRSRWHIDHIIPLASAEDEEELRRLCHYTNLRPLWGAENLSKGAKQITHQMALL